MLPQQTSRISAPRGAGGAGANTYRGLKCSTPSACLLQDLAWSSAYPCSNQDN